MDEQLFDIVKENISELEDTARETIQTETQREKSFYK